MGKTRQEKLAGLHSHRRAKIADRTATLIAEGKSLSELRRARTHPENPRQEARCRASEHFKAREPQ